MWLITSVNPPHPADSKNKPILSPLSYYTQTGAQYDKGDNMGLPVSYVHVLYTLNLFTMKSLLYLIEADFVRQMNCSQDSPGPTLA